MDMVDSYDRHIDMIDTYDMIDRWYCRHILWSEKNRFRVASCTALWHSRLSLADSDADLCATGPSCDRHHLSFSAPSCSDHERHDEGLDHAPFVTS